MKSTRDLLRNVEYRKFDRPRSVRDYGFEDGRPIEQPGSPSGYLLPWSVLDDETEARAMRRPSQYVITGEYVTEGIVHPEIAVSNAYMRWLGYERVGGKWKWSVGE